MIGYNHPGPLASNWLKLSIKPSIFARNSAPPLSFGYNISPLTEHKYRQIAFDSNTAVPFSSSHTSIGTLPNGFIFRYSSVLFVSPIVTGTYSNRIEQYFAVTAIRCERDVGPYSFIFFNFNKNNNKNNCTLCVYIYLKDACDCVSVYK